MEDGAQCLICHEGLLTQTPCALRCGHVYHSACLQQWFEKGKGECPQCKAKSSRFDLLVLDFEVAHVQPRSVEEVRKLEALSSEERLRIREELSLQLEDEAACLREAWLRLDERREAAQARKRARKELEESAPALETEIAGLQRERDAAAVENAKLGAKVDSQNTRQRQLLHGARSQEAVSEEDADSKEERRKLRLMRPADRARQLHEAVVSARQQEAEANRASRDREAAVKELQAELAELRKMEVRLRKELERRKEQDLLAAEARGPLAERRKASSTSLSSDSSITKRPRQATPSSTESLGAALPVDTSAPATAAGGGAVDFGDEDLLYGGMAPRKTASVSVVARGASAVLGGRPAAPAAPAAVAFLATPARRQNSLQSLFAMRKA